jgi:hypothetical protein
LLNPLGRGIRPEEKVYFGPQKDIRAPCMQEVSAVTGNVKNNRAPTEDYVTA